MPTPNNNFDQLMNRIAKPSLFDTFLNESQIAEVPAKYIERIIIYYSGGKSMEFTGRDIDQPIPIRKKIRQAQFGKLFDRMEEFKIFVDTVKLEKDVNIEVNKYLDRF